MKRIMIQLQTNIKSLNIFIDKYEVLVHLTYFAGLFCFYYVPLLGKYGYAFNNNATGFSVVIAIVLGTTNIMLFKLLSGDNHFITLVATVISFQVIYPELVYYAFNNQSLVVPFTGLLSIYILLYMSRTINNEERESSSLPLFITGTTIVVLCIPFLKYLPYINLKNLLLQDIYETRYLFQSVSTPLMLYLIAPLTRVLFPVVFVQSLKEKKYLVTGLYFLLYIYIFLCGAYRSIFLGLIATAVFYFGNYNDKKNFYIGFMSIGIYLSLFASVPIIMVGTNLLRRLLFVPPGMNNVYITEFLGNPTFFAHSGLTFGLLGNPFGNLPKYIGEQVMGIPGLSANVGIFVEGFVGFEYFGIIVSVLMICGFVYLFNKISIPVEYFGIVYVFIYYFNNSLISTLLLTHGLFFTFVFFFFVSNKNSWELFRKKFKNR